MDIVLVHGLFMVVKLYLLLKQKIILKWKKENYMLLKLLVVLEKV